MSNSRTLLLAGNWKMNHDHLESISTVQKLAWALRDAKVESPADCEVVVLPPFTDIRSVQTLVQGDKLGIGYGGQDLSTHDSGAYTGEISGAFLNKLGCTYVVIGHSERRAYHGETDAIVNEKIGKALQYDLAPIVCVGEGESEREAGTHVEYTLAQLRGALEGHDAQALGDSLVVAYEPVWAIGTGKTATSDDAAQMCTAIREELSSLLGADAAAKVRVLYGGSVKAANVAELVANEDVDGALVGGASLVAEDFSALCAAAVSK